MRTLIKLLIALLLIPLLSSASASESRNESIRAEEGRTTLVIVFKDGRTQTFSLADIARIEFRGTIISGGGEDTSDPAVGTWAWFTGATIVVSANGTFVNTTDRSLYGTWRLTKTNPRVYVFNWVNGRYIDTLTLSADGRKLDGSNVGGVHVWGTKK